MGASTNFTVTDGVLVFTTETGIIIRVLICTVILITLLLITLLMIYKWTGQRHKVTRLDTHIVSTADVPPEWDQQGRRQRRIVNYQPDGGASRHRPGHAEWPSSNVQRKLKQANNAAKCRANKKKQKRIRNKNNKWYRENVSQLDWSNLDDWSDFCNKNVN
jgi:hypothetical protein